MPVASFRTALPVLAAAAAFTAATPGAHAGVIYNNVQQERNPAGPASVPDFSLPNQLLLPTPGYEIQDDDASAADVTQGTFNFTFDADVDPGQVATSVGLRQRLGFEFDDPEELANSVDAQTVATIAYTEVNGLAVDPDDPANQQVFVLEETFQTTDFFPAGFIEILVPLDAPATALEVRLDNTLTAFSVSGTALITGADLQFITLTTPVPEPASLALFGLGTLLIARRRKK